MALQVPVAARVGEAAGELVERPPLEEEPAAVAETPRAPVNPLGEVAARPVDEAGGPAAMPDGVRLLLRVLIVYALTSYAIH